MHQKHKHAKHHCRKLSKLDSNLFFFRGFAVCTSVHVLCFPNEPAATNVDEVAYKFSGGVAHAAARLQSTALPLSKLPTFLRS